MELSPHEDTADDEFCAWYSRPDLEHACFSHNANLLPTDLCTECKESTSHELIEIYHNFRGDYTFRKTYAEIRRDAAVCALCRAIDDSSHLSRLLPPIATPPVIPPPDSTIHLKGLFYDSFGIGMKKGGYFVSARGSTRSSSGFAYEPIRLGYLDPIISQSIDTDANTSERIRRFRTGQAARRHRRPLYSFTQEPKQLFSRGELWARGYTSINEIHSSFMASNL